MTKNNNNINFKTAGNRINTATNFMITLIKKGRTVKWLVSLLAILMLAASCEKPDPCEGVKESYKSLQDKEAAAAQNVRKSIQAIQATPANNMWSGNFATMMNLYVTNNNITRPLNIDDTVKVSKPCSEGMLKVTGLPGECIDPLNKNIVACTAYNDADSIAMTFFSNNTACINK